jgi:hypothetical protein
MVHGMILILSIGLRALYTATTVAGSRDRRSVAFGYRHTLPGSAYTPGAGTDAGVGTLSIQRYVERD